MAKLNDTALTILASAAAREDARVLPLPTGLKTPKSAVRKVLEQLLAGELLAEVPARHDEETWRETEETGRTTLMTTSTGLAAIGIDAGRDSEQATKGKSKRKTKAPGTLLTSKSRPAAVKKPDLQRRGKTTIGSAGGVSKQDAVLQLLRQKQGTSIAEMMAATGWQAHSVRGFLSGTVKTKMKLAVASEKEKSGERRYRIASGKGGRG